MSGHPRNSDLTYEGAASCSVILPWYFQTSAKGWVKVRQKLRLWGWQQGFGEDVRKGSAGHKYDSDRSPLPGASLSTSSEGHISWISSLRLSYSGEDEEETFKQLVSSENPFLLNNPAARLDRPSFSLKN